MNAPRSPLRNNQWAVYIALALTIAGIVYQGGILSGHVDNNDRRITRLEAIDQSRTDQIGAINVRTARIETKLDDFRRDVRP